MTKINFQRMDSAIMNYLKQQQKDKTNNVTNTESSNTTEDTKAVQGTIRKDKVIIDGESYPYEVVVDIPTEEGDKVWCLLAESGTGAIVIGR